MNLWCQAPPRHHQQCLDFTTVQHPHKFIHETTLLIYLNFSATVVFINAPTDMRRHISFSLINKWILHFLSLSHKFFSQFQGDSLYLISYNLSSETQVRLIINCHVKNIRESLWKLVIVTFSLINISNYVYK